MDKFPQYKILISMMRTKEGIKFGIYPKSFGYVLIMATILLVSACTSIPFSTMWKLRSFGANDLKILNPADIRVAIKLPEKLLLDPDKTTFDVTLVPKGAPQTPVHEKGALILLNKGVLVPENIPAAESGKIWYLLKLSPAGIKAFQDFQNKLNPNPERYYKSFSFKIDFGFEQSVKKSDFDDATITVKLRLKRKENFFVLFDEASFEFE